MVLCPFVRMQARVAAGNRIRAQAGVLGIPAGEA